MADLATVFHWAPSVMDAMSLSELMGWRARAEARNRPPETTGPKGKR